MKHVKSHILSAYCPWTDASAWSSRIASGPRKQIKFTGSPAGLALPGDMGPFSREWQANSMDQPVDEHTKSDLVAIADARQLAAALNARAGIVEHGLFIGLATDLIVAGADGIRYSARHSHSNEQSS